MLITCLNIVINVALLKCAAGSKQEEIRRMGRFLSHSGMRTVLSNADELQLKMMEEECEHDYREVIIGENE